MREFASIQFVFNIEYILMKKRFVYAFASDNNTNTVKPINFSKLNIGQFVGPENRVENFKNIILNTLVIGRS